MKTRFFLFGTLDTMYAFEENEISHDKLDLHEVVAFEDQDITQMMLYVQEYGYFTEINEEMFNKILNL